MPVSLSKNHRKLLERTTLDAREMAERAARSALENLAVHEKDNRPHMDVATRLLRNRLRARGRALGDLRDERSGTQSIAHLKEDVAYEQWHRLLFTRFLAENHLLHTDEEHDTVPVTLEECEELASELGARDGFELACRFASRTLPGVFRREDPVLDLRLAPNDEVELRGLLDSLPSEVFQTDDALGWTYQFWQAKRKDEVNASGVKIGADELPAVTQLFTEDYMVEFLLHNTLGAWWAGMQGPITAGSEEEARRQSRLPARDGLPEVNWTYLRFVQDDNAKAWTPAAGTFEDWPKTAAKIRVLDPCMGSGHFLAFALPILARLRMEEENISAGDAVTVVLRDNLHGLEIDPRCTQIGAFNLALTAWKLTGWQTLPQLHIACCGLAPQAKLSDWLKLAKNDQHLEEGMKQLYELFRHAPVLGSLIDSRSTREVTTPSYAELEPLLHAAIAEGVGDDGRRETAVAADGIAKAAQMLAVEYTLVTTNVPYLGRGKHHATLKHHCERIFPEAKGDLATCFIDRCAGLSSPSGHLALLTPQNWWFSPGYRAFRWRLLSVRALRLLATLGEEAWQTFGDRGPLASMLIASKAKPSPQNVAWGGDALPLKTIAEKARALALGPLSRLVQSALIANPDSVLTLNPINAQNLLAKHCESWQGLVTSDNPRFMFMFWEAWGSGWLPFISSPTRTRFYGGRENVVAWFDATGPLHTEGKAHNFPPRSALGRRGVLLSQVRSLSATLYTGEVFAHGSSPVIPASEALLPALWCFLSSEEYRAAVRNIDKKLAVTNSTLLKVEFDASRWTSEATSMFPRGLPTPHSDDPTQWLFNGDPQGSEQPLQVAVARLLGYVWPRQTGSSFPDCPALDPDDLEPLADDDGIVCLPPINREQPGAARLRALLAKAVGKFDERALIAATGSKKRSLEDWLRDEFFDQHCDLFHQRPFLWHVWDGRKDGFHALVNYHRLDQANLKKLAYSYLGDWIRHQEDEAKADKPGAAGRLGAARELQGELARILEGEPPYDIFVRWKSLAQQPLAWQPDLNDGVRLNIRPFVLAKDVDRKGAGVLRSKPGVKWTKDRGKEPDREKAEYPWFWCDDEPGTDPPGGKKFTGNRWNSTHLTLAFKRAARGKG